MPLLEAHRLARGLPNLGGPPVFAGISFVVEAGDRLFIRGPSGAGKTLLLRSLALLDPLQVLAAPRTGAQQMLLNMRKPLRRATGAAAHAPRHHGVAQRRTRPERRVALTCARPPLILLLNLTGRLAAAARREPRGPWRARLALRGGVRPPGACRLPWDAAGGERCQITCA